MNKGEILLSIEKVAELLYQENETEAYEGLTGLIRQLAKASEQITEKESQGDFILALKMALDAMEEKDHTLLADVLLYEVKPRLEVYI